MDQAFITVHGWLSSGGAMAMTGALLWGVISVALSPCHLASIPLIVGYVAGQERAARPGQAAAYSLAFTAGLFITIAVVGLACSLLGLMLGDVGPYWTIAVGVVLLWVALDMLGLRAMNISGGLMARLKARGVAGAFVLGLAYGLLSGSCTFGFLAPIMAVITVQRELATGLALIALFGLGHALPIAVAGGSTALVGKTLENKSFQTASLCFRRLAGVGVGLLGLYFVARPFLAD